MAEETPDLDFKARVRRVQDLTKSYIRQKRRERASKRKGGSRGMAYGLVSSLIVLLVAFGFCLTYVFYNSDTKGPRLQLNEVTALAEQGRITNAVLKDADSEVVASYSVYKDPVDPKTGRVTGTFVVDPQLPSGSPATDKFKHGDFHFSLPSNGQAWTSLVTQLRASNANYTVDKQSTKQVVKTVATFLLPLMILANLFALLFSLGKQGGGAIGEVMTFGKIGKGEAKKGKSYIGFDDVGGAEEAVAELREVRDYLMNPAKYEALGAAPPKGVLLFGPPGTGKTLLAKAVAGEAGVPFFSVAGAEFVESLVGVGAARVRDLFARVRAAAPAIVFIDELDAAGRKRGSGGGGGGSDEREQTLNQLLVEMDGFEVSAGIVVMGATNRPDILDPALMRPGRFDRHITIERPELEGRVHILKIHGRGKPLSPEVNLELIAEKTPGFTGADLANVVNEATLLTIRELRTEVTMKDFDDAIERVLNGPKRRGRVLSVEERQRTAFHEAGHVIVAAAAGRAQEVERVSILARGRAVATTRIQADDEATLLSRTQLRGKLVTLMGGIAAENLVFGEGSTGGEQDIEQATDLARDIVARYGMSPTLGPVRLMAKASDGFLGGDIPLADISVDTQREVDEEIRRLLAEAQAEATAMLSRHRTTLDSLASRLDQEETLEGEALLEVLAPIEAEMAGEKFSPTGKAPARSNGTRTRRTTKAPARTS
ncbi:MAG TPA: ATP-dependent zinc metalloprotease FtsH [Mycobacteriales bacterium]|jgi:cell division protease FtsH|nr:ATP-dependent zinc metalloprotease FtsH [Mycobacteriales bacterium]